MSAAAAASAAAGAASRRGARTASLRDFLKLSKHKLSALVAFTASAGYLCRAEDDVDTQPATSSASPSDVASAVPARAPDNASWRSLLPSFEPGSLPRGLLATTAGTFLCAASANTLNQLYERVSDGVMSRTRGRPLPAGRVSPRLAALFAAATAASGVGLLRTETNDVAAGLAGLNVALYAGVYTPLKAVSPACTWVGAVVGALPPLLGWAAASDGSLTGERERGAWALAGWLFAWQIPHFHALAVLLRRDYAAAGIRMLAVSEPVANARWAHRMALAMLPVGPAVAMAGVASMPFVVEATALSWWMLRGARRLVDDPTSVAAARQLFTASIVQLPVCMGFLLLHRVPYESYDELARRRAAAAAAADNVREVRILQPWEVMAPFPFLPVPYGAPAVVLERPTER